MKKPLYSQDDVQGGYSLSKKKQNRLISKGAKFKTVKGKIMYTNPQVEAMLRAAGRVLVEDSNRNIKWIFKENVSKYLEEGYKVIEE